MNPKLYSFVTDAAKRIDVTKLPHVLYLEKALLPTYGGIYFVGTDQEPTAYIGQTECFKTRFIGHHRQKAFEQLVEEFGQKSVKIRYWQAPAMVKSELTVFLLQLEIYLIRNLKTRFNYTAISPPKPPPPFSRIRSPVYVQLNQLRERYVERSEDGTGGFYLSLGKLHLAENAVKYRSPAFMISSGTWKDAVREFEGVKPEWKQYPTLYFLEMRFRARKVDYLGQGGIEDYLLSGDRATFHQIFLNEEPGFKEFSVQYLRTGLTNCSRSVFCETLLKLTGSVV